MKEIGSRGKLVKPEGIQAVLESRKKNEEIIIKGGRLILVSAFLKRVTLEGRGERGKGQERDSGKKLKEKVQTGGERVQSQITREV